MVKEVKNNIAGIISLCERMEVKSHYVFGSGARNNHLSDNSHLDFFYSMFTDKDGLPKGDYFDLWFGLEKITGKKVDLVNENGICNKYFLMSILVAPNKIYEA